MNIDVAGRVRNVQLPTTKPLLPLFEAIMNSIHAIEDANQKDGRIEIEVLRDGGMLFPESEVSGFVVKDNGIGFDDRNYEAFVTSDTTFKASRGGKGIGRFMWLAAFDRVEVDSAFGSPGHMKRRQFEFCPRETGIEKLVSSDIADAERCTAVKLLGFKEKFRKESPKRLITIAGYIVEEFLEYFIGPTSPLIILRDSVNGDSVSLDNFFDEEMASQIERDKFQVKEQNFEILHIRLYSTHVSEHRLNLCAHARVVRSERLAGRIANLTPKLTDERNEDFLYAAYVNSRALDDAVNPDRTAFMIPANEGEMAFDDVGLRLDEIRSAAWERCKRFVEPYTGPIADRKRARVEEFIRRDGVMYRPILPRLQDAIEDIDPDASDEEIDLKLYDGYNRLQTRLKAEGQQLLKSAPPADQEFEQFENRLQTYFEEISEVKQADLARYVCHRRAILDFFRSQLGMQEGGKYNREGRLHGVIFPQGKTSDEVLFEDHNLWLVDERLAFHTFLSSDKPIRQLRNLKNTSRKEPDILVFDKAIALSEGRDVPFSSITIVEFKKPQRNEYSETENPFTQVANYIDEIKAGRARTEKGLSMPISETLPFYCYIVCDITERLKTWARLSELQPTPDELGYYGYKRGYNAYFEVISYTKLLADAEKRNKAFFHKLGL